MACPTLHTGSQFLSTTLANLDCQGRTIGAYGYGALSDPASGVATLLTGLLTLFIALYGIRMMLGHTASGRDVVTDMLRVGLVLTIATSWPAWRVIGYNLVLDSPAEVARSVGMASGLPGANGNIISRLQNADDGLVSVTEFGTGRLTGGVVGGSDLGDTFHGIALADQAGLGWGRIAFLVGAITSFAISRIGAGLLLAIAPLMAGLMLFSGTWGVFSGWLRSLLFVSLASLTWTICSGVELALLVPWINDTLSARQANTFTPSAPTELLVLAAGITILSFGLLAIVAKMAFQSEWSLSRLVSVVDSGAHRLQSSGFWRPETGSSAPSQFGDTGTSRAHAVADAIAVNLRREQEGGWLALHRQATGISADGNSTPRTPESSAEPASGTLGSSYRRTHTRQSRSGASRDRQA